MVLYPLLISIMSIALLYYCTRYFFGHRAGLIGAFIFAFLPIDITNATRLLPDMPAAFYGSFGITCILFFLNTTTQHRLIPLSGGIIAGVLFGLSWLCKESIVYYVPFCLALVVMTIKKDFHRNIVIWIGVAAGSLSVLLVESIAYYNLTGDLTFRFHEIERNYRELENGFFTEGSKFGWDEGSSYTKALLKRLFIVGPETIFLNSQFLFTPFLGLIASLYAAYSRERSFLIPALWMITLAVMFNFSSSSTSSYTPLVLFNRYLYPVFFPAIILTGGFFDRLLFAKNKEDENHISAEAVRERFFWGAIFALLFIIITGYQTLNYIRHAKIPQGWAQEGRILSAILSPSDRIYTDILNMKSLEFFWKYPKKMEIIDFEGMQPTNDIPAGSYILTHPGAINWLEVNAGMWLSKGNVYVKPYFYENIPPSWKVVWQNSRAILYKVE